VVVLLILATTLEPDLAYCLLPNVGAEQETTIILSAGIARKELKIMLPVPVISTEQLETSKGIDGVIGSAVTADPNFKRLLLHT
jgi:hypothetical protein